MNITEASSFALPSVGLSPHRNSGVETVAYPGIHFGGGSTNSVEDRGQREWGSGGIAPYSGVLEAAVIWYKKFHFI